MRKWEGLLGFGVGVLFPIALTLKKFSLGLFFRGSLGGLGLALGEEGGVPPPLQPLVLPLLLLLPLLLQSLSSPTLVKPARCTSTPAPCIPASQRSKPCNTQSTMLGSIPNMRPSSVTPTMWVRPPAVPPLHLYSGVEAHHL